MSKYAGLTAQISAPRETTPSELASKARLAVQLSLYGRLRKRHGGPLAGRLAWAMLRAVQADHPDHRAAVDLLSEQTAETLKAWIAAARGARDALPSADASRLAGEIVGILEATLGNLGTPEERNGRRLGGGAL